MNRQFISIIVIIGMTIALVGWILSSSSDLQAAREHTPAHNDETHENHAGHNNYDTHVEHTRHSEHEGHDDEIETGPHGGRLLTQGNFSLEITLFETGLPPEFRVFVYDDGAPVDLTRVALAIELHRTGNKVDHIAFVPQQDFLRGDTVIHEPHSFAVEVKADYAGKSYAWHYEDFEGRTRIPAAMAQEMDIQTEPVGPVNLVETRTLTGRVQTNPNRLSRVRPRFPGVVKAIRRELGDSINAGDTLATIQSNESLQNYNIKAPIGGVIVKRDVQVGEATGVEPLFIIADLSEVWVELDVFVRDLDLVKQGQSVLIETLDKKQQVEASIDWVSPLAAHASQSVRARVSLNNKDGHFRPGQFIRGHVTVAERMVPLAVRQSALQSFRDFQVVFARFDDIYEVRMLELGRKNPDWVEVLGGIENGVEYVTRNSYLIKADIEKSGASHAH